MTENDTTPEGANAAPRTDAKFAEITEKWRGNDALAIVTLYQWAQELEREAAAVPAMLEALRKCQDWFKATGYGLDLSDEVAAALELATKGVVKPSESDPLQDPDYQVFMEEVAKDCLANGAPCGGCLAGGMCDGPDRDGEWREG